MRLLIAAAKPLADREETDSGRAEAAAGPE